MKKRKSNQRPVVVLLILLLLCAALLGGMIWFVSSHFFVGGKAYPNDARELDLRNQILSVEEYDAIRSKLPDCEIRWNIPFQNSAYPDTTTSVAVRSLSDADLKVLGYFPDLAEVDATGCEDYDQIQKLQKQYPDVSVWYTVSIGGQEYPQDAAAVTSPELTEEDIAMMAYLPELKSVDASQCRDYSRLAVLADAFPDVDISYRVEVLGQTFTEADVAAVFKNPDVAVLTEQLAYASHLESVHLVEPAASAQDLRQLMEAYPDRTIIWDKTVLGKTFNSAATEYDLTDLSLSDDYLPKWMMESMPAEETARITKTVEEAMAYFPNAEKVILPAYYFHNETMSAFREKMRPEYKVVWTVYVTRKPVRTDQEVIHSSAYRVCFIDEQSQDLKYCEDAIVVDIGHSYVKDISWVRGMPNLKYLILTHNWVKDLTPLESCKKLVYLEMFWNDHIPDYSPILGCTALEDLNVSATWADIEPLYEMTWLKNLWANCKGITAKEDAALKEALPNTTVMTTGGSYTTGGWRQVQGYYDMRDIMGLPYNHW